jgi:hypothetical protein
MNAIIAKLLPASEKLSLGAYLQLFAIESECALHVLQKLSTTKTIPARASYEH